MNWDWRGRGHYALNALVRWYGDLPIAGPVFWWAFRRWQRLM